MVDLVLVYALVGDLVRVAPFTVPSPAHCNRKRNVGTAASHSVMVRGLWHSVTLVCTVQSESIIDAITCVEVVNSITITCD